MARAYGVQSFLRLIVDVGGNDLAYKDYMVADRHLRFERAFKIGHGVG